MKARVLIISPDTTTEQLHSQFLVEQGFIVDVVGDGKSAQVSLTKHNYQYAFLDVETANYSCLEVIRFIQARLTNLEVFLTFNDEQKLKDLGLTESAIKKYGVRKTLLSPTGKDLLGAIKGLGKIQKWEDVEKIESRSEVDETESTIGDNEFTRIKIDEVLYDSLAILDFYIRLGANRYVKIIHKGEHPSEQQIQKYAKNGTKHLYFLNKDRSAFISYQNDVARLMIKDGTESSAKIVKTLKTVTDKYIEEVYVEGLQPALIEEGKAICQNMFNLTQKDNNLRTLMGNLEEFSSTVYSHSFLVCFFTTIIAKNLSWVGTATQEALSIGALFHDIGLLQLPEGIKNKCVTVLSDAELLMFHQHPNLGREALNNMSIVTNMTKEIVLQHHETIDGKGFPFGLSGLKIYPMAKIVGLADTFADLLIEKGIPPRIGIKEFLAVRENLVKYDGELVKSLVKGFVPINK